MGFLLWNKTRVTWKSTKDGSREQGKTTTEKENEPTFLLDARVCHLKDKLVRAKVYLSFSATRNNPHFMRKLWLLMKEVLRTIGDATKDSEIEKISFFVGYPYFSMFRGSQAFDEMAWRFSLFFFIFQHSFVILYFTCCALILVPTRS